MLLFPGKMKTRPSKRSVLSGCRELVKREMTVGSCMFMLKISCLLVGSFKRMVIVTKEMSVSLSMRGLLRIQISRFQTWLMGLSHVLIMKEAFAQRDLSVGFFSSISLNKLTNKCLVRVSSVRITQLDFVLLALNVNTNT